VAVRIEHAHRDGPRRARDGPLVTRPKQFTSLRYGERLAEIGAVPSIGSVGDSYDNALAEAVIIRSPDLGVVDIELATLSWVTWFNTVRLHGTLNDIPPTEYEAAHYVHQTETNQPVGIQ